jgi:hypothetical protein
MEDLHEARILDWKGFKLLSGRFHSDILEFSRCLKPECTASAK